MYIKKIVSIIIASITAIACIACYFIAINKNKSNVTYAKSINFTNGTGGCELLIDNQLILNNSLLTIQPANCSFSPEYSVTKYGSKSTEDIKVNGDNYKFNNSGKYIVKCSIKSGEYDSNYTSATMTIKVVDTPTSSTNMYIKPTGKSVIHLGETLDISTFADITYCKEASINILTNECLKYSNGNITAVKEGLGSIEIYLKLLDVYIYHKLDIQVQSKIEYNTKEIEFTLGDNIYNNNDTLNISLSTESYCLSYTLLNYVNQQIECTTDNDNISIITVDTPIIMFNTLQVGTSTLYITPYENCNITFKIYIVVS